MFILNWFSTETPVKQEVVIPKNYSMNYDEYRNIMARLKVAEEKLDALDSKQPYTPTATPVDIVKEGKPYQLSDVEYNDITNRLKLIEARLEGRKNTRVSPNPTPSPVPCEKVIRAGKHMNPFQCELGHMLAKRRIDKNMQESHGFDKNELANIIEDYENRK
jgi:tetrahydromethanopterin S-methyltransferase subunit G